MNRLEITLTTTVCAVCDDGRSHPQRRAEEKIKSPNIVNLPPIKDMLRLTVRFYLP